MNFEFSEEQQMLREQARGFLAEHCTTAVVRAVLDGDSGWDSVLWQKIAEMGWTATTVPEAYGGLGLSYYELAVIAEELGRAVAPVPFSSSVYLACEAINRFGTEGQKSAWLPRLATAASATVVLVPLMRSAVRWVCNCSSASRPGRSAMANAATHSPLANRGSQADFCPSVPKRLIASQAR